MKTPTACHRRTPPQSANTAEKGAGRVQDRNHFTHFHKKHVRKTYISEVISSSNSTCLVLFLYFLMILVLWGPLGGQLSSRPSQNHKSSKKLHPFGGHFGVILQPWRHFLGSIFLMYFWKATFCVLHRFLVPNVAQRLPELTNFDHFLRMGGMLKMYVLL